jgi:tetratricopeptide (TPR) repeat protein
VSFAGLFLSVVAAQPLAAQTQRPSGSSSSSPDSQATDPVNAPARIAQAEARGSAITLETSEPLFDLAVALNACGYDADLAQSSPVRMHVREQVNQALADSAPARDARDALCVYIRGHALTDAGRSLAQYISLALYLLPPPALTPTVSEVDLPAEAAPVVNVLPLLRTFAEDINLHGIWVSVRPEYEALVDRVHDPLTAMVLGTNIYLHLPVSSYDGRRFLVLLEPMLSPLATNARYGAVDSVVVVSPAAPTAERPATRTDALVPMDLIRHTYLHYTVEPLVYARAAAMDRLLPLLKPVQEAPIDFIYRSDIVALITECLIKAIEAQTLPTGLTKPVRPDAGKQRAGLAQYDTEMSVYEHKSETLRRQTVDLDMRQGWVLVGYFYDQLGQMEKEYIGQMVYGMDVDRERRHDMQIVFLPEVSHDMTTRSLRQPTGLDLAEMKLMKGDMDGAGEIAEKALAAPAAEHPANRAEATYILARISLMQNDPDDAVARFTETLRTSKDPRTLAWSHIYLGRLYDMAGDPDRTRALAEYRAALADRDSQPDTKAAAEAGLKQAFAPPKRTATSSDQEKLEEPIDPSGKAEKDAYRPPQ